MVRVWPGSLSPRAAIKVKRRNMANIALMTSSNTTKLTRLQRGGSSSGVQRCTGTPEAITARESLADAWRSTPRHLNALTVPHFARSSRRAAPAARCSATASSYGTEPGSFASGHRSAYGSGSASIKKRCHARALGHFGSVQNREPARRSHGRRQGPDHGGQPQRPGNDCLALLPAFNTSCCASGTPHQ